MPDPYRDDDLALHTRLDSLLDQLDRRRARLRELSTLETETKQIEREIRVLRRKLEARASTSSSSLLDQVSIAAPCPADWDGMTGDETTRYCRQCKKHVHNLSAMTRHEAERFLQGLTGDACVRIFQRADGTVMTEDCPVGVRTKTRRRRVLSVLGGGVAAATALSVYDVAQTSAGCHESMWHSTETRSMAGAISAFSRESVSESRRATLNETLVRLFEERDATHDAAKRVELEQKIRSVNDELKRGEGCRPGDPACPL